MLRSCSHSTPLTNPYHTLKTAVLHVMELQLCLSLPTHNPVKGFDLNNSGFEPEEKKWRCLDGKQSFDDASQASLLPLLLWCGKPNDDDDLNRENKKISCSINKRYRDESDDQVVGWPPINSWRRKLFHDHHNHQGGCRVANTNPVMDRAENVNSWRRKLLHDHRHHHVGCRVPNTNPVMGREENVNSWRRKLIHDHHHHQSGCCVANINPVMGREENVNDSGIKTNSMFVKVKMEGVAIARKIDLRLYSSYQKLKSSLINMFDKSQEQEKDVAGYTLTYIGKDGEWSIAGDVPWQTFIESVQRLQIIRNGS